MKNPYFDLIKTVWHYGITRRTAIIGYYLAYIIAQTILGFSPYALGRTIDVLQHFTPDRIQAVIFWLVMDVLILFLFWVFHGPARVVERNVALEIEQNFRLNIYEQLTHLPLPWHQNHHSGNTITRLTRAAVALRQFAESQFIYIEAIIKFIVSIGFLLWLSIPIGLLSFSASTLVVTLVFWFDRHLIPLYKAENDIENHVGSVLFDYVSNMTTILTLRLGSLTHNNLMQRLKAIWPFFRKEAVINEVKWFSVTLFLNLIQALLLIGYILHLVHGHHAILIGTVVMIFRYQWDLSNVFQELSVHYSELVRMNTDTHGIDPILEDIAKLAHLPAGASLAQHWQQLTVSNLAFQHDLSLRGKIFHDLNFAIKRGEKIALIGSSGGGKSTLLNLLGGLYTPQQVKLTIDGAAFNSLEPLQSITTLIPQDPEIFENTIAFNITLDLPVSVNEIHTAVKLAAFDSILSSLPLGLETDIREKGLNFSVGQKQRLALARGLFAARYSSLILMDEPTSSVDLPTEKQILASVIAAFPEAAVVVSLHRLHLLPKFDTVLMVSDGQIIAHGPTAMLLQQPGPVYELWQSYQQRG